MKWLFLFDEDHLFGGFQTCINELSRELLIRGHHVDILYFRKNPFETLADQFPEQCAVRHATIDSTRSLRLTSLKTAWRYLRSSRPDAIFFCCTGVPNYLPFVFLAPLAGVTDVVAQFGTEVELPLPLPSRRHLGGLIRGLGLWRKELLWSAILAYRNLTLCLFNNDHQLKSWSAAMHLNAHDCTLWNYPIDLELFRPFEDDRETVRRQLGIAPDAFVIGGVGGLNRQKSFDISIRALAELRHQLPEAQLVLAGDGPMRGELESLACELGIADRVHLLGQRSDVQRLMNAFDIFCMPSAHLNETLGIVFVEAQACGVPIVVPDLPGPRRVARNGQCGVVVPPGDIRAFAAAWLELAMRPDSRQSLRSQGYLAAHESDRRTVVDWLLLRMKDSDEKKQSMTFQRDRKESLSHSS